MENEEHECYFIYAKIRKFAKLLKKKTRAKLF